MSLSSVASCEALGVVCGVNSFCDLSECKCHEGYYNNGTQGVEEDESEGEEATEEALTKERLGIYATTVYI